MAAFIGVLMATVIVLCYSKQSETYQRSYWSTSSYCFIAYAINLWVVIRMVMQNVTSTN